MTAPTSTELKDAAKLVPTIANFWDLAIIQPTIKFDLDAIEGVAAVIIEKIDELKNLTTLKSKAVILDKVQRLVSIKDAIAKIGSSLRGGRVFTEESFKSAVEGACDPAHREYWDRESGGFMVTLMDEFPQISEELRREHGVVVWSGVDADPLDRFIRVVNVNWLSDPSEIHAFVTTEPRGIGKACRCCLAVEPPDSFALAALNAPEGNMDVLITDGRRTQVLQKQTVYLHARCKNIWLEWLDVAQKFAEAA